MRIELITSHSDIESTFHVMRQLRPQLQGEAYVQIVRELMDDGYRMVVVRDGSHTCGVAGFRVGRCLAWNRYLYVEDLVSDESHRSRGFGKALVDWLVDHARELGCHELHLDSGVHRFGAHRFYLRERMDIVSHHFRMQL